METIVVGRSYGVALYAEGTLEEISALVEEGVGDRLQGFHGPGDDQWHMGCGYRTRLGGFRTRAEAAAFAAEFRLPEPFKLY